MRGTYLPDDVPPQPDECFCEGQPGHIHHPWGWRQPEPQPPEEHNCRFEYCDAPTGECEHPE